MKKINIVYQNRNMPVDVLEPIMAPDGSYQIVWSRQPQPGFDAVVYFNQYAYDHRLHDQICPDALRVLYMYEPVAIDPMQYTRRVWRQFDVCITWNTYLTGKSSAFVFDPAIYYDLPYCGHYGIPVSEDAHEALLKREKAICQICGDKFSLSAEELYSLRRDIARWFHRHGTMRMDVFGRPPMEVPNYRGISDNKLETFSAYRYALCFENSYHPLWTRGYLTEKILDCMAAGTVPVYYGCSNIEELVPPDCFIDYRAFDSFEALEQHLLHMSDDEYLGYVERMHRFLAAYNAPQRHSAFRLYETLAAVCSQPLPNASQYPADYLRSCSWAGRLRFEGMRLLLPYHRFVYPAFAVVRKINRFFAGLWKPRAK